jgi:hypothetical protein
MNPRFLFLLALAMAGAGFECALLLENDAPRGVRVSETGMATTLYSAGVERGTNIQPNQSPLPGPPHANGTGTTGNQATRTPQTETTAGAENGTSRLSMRWENRRRLLNASEETLEEEIQKASLHPFDGFRSADQAFAVRRLAELHPERAAELWAKNGEFRTQPGLFLKDWISTDPAAFLSWNLSQPEDVQKASAVALGNLAKESPQQFAELAAQLGGSPAGPSAARSAIRGMREAEKDNPQKALEYARSLPEGQLRNAALVELLHWPEAKAVNEPTVLEALNQISPEDARRLGRELGKVAEQLPTGVARESAFAASLRQEAGKDPTAAARHLDSLAGSSDYAAAVRGFVEETARKDPAGAAEWALSIPESAPLQRMAALERLAATWFESAPGEARAWVEKASLTDTEYFRLTGRQRQR